LPIARHYLIWGAHPELGLYRVGAPPQKHRLSPSRRRALELLASSPFGAAKAIMLTHGFTRGTLAGLVRAGLAMAQRGTVNADRRSVGGRIKSTPGKKPPVPSVRVRPGRTPVEQRSGRKPLEPSGQRRATARTETDQAETGRSGKTVSGTAQTGIECLPKRFDARGGASYAPPAAVARASCT
jgi:hypothetical protein